MAARQRGAHTQKAERWGVAGRHGGEVAGGELGCWMSALGCDGVVDSPPKAKGAPSEDGEQTNGRAISSFEGPPSVERAGVTAQLVSNLRCVSDAGGPKPQRLLGVWTWGFGRPETSVGLALRWWGLFKFEI